jgi:hypothetical protein
MIITTNIAFEHLPRAFAGRARRYTKFDALGWVLQQVIFELGTAKAHFWSIITTASPSALYMAPKLPQSESDPLFVFDAPNWILRSIYDDQ